MAPWVILKYLTGWNAVCIYLSGCFSPSMSSALPWGPSPLLWLVPKVLMGK